MSESFMKLPREERMEKLSKMQPLDRLAVVTEGYCIICADDACGNRVKCRRDGWATSCAVHNAESKVCPQCKDPGCRRLPVEQLNREHLMDIFKDASEALSKMNPSMYVIFEKTRVQFGIDDAQEDGPTRGSRGTSYANATAFVEKGRGHVALDEGEFIGWSFCMRSAHALGDGLHMLRTIVHADGRKTTENIGSATDWLIALLYGFGMYPTLVGHVSNGRTVEIALACNPSLPGFLLLSNETPALTAVDIPSRVWGGMATFNDPRVFALSALGSPVQIMKMGAAMLSTHDHYLELTPTKSFRDMTGCLVEEFHGIERNHETMLSVMSLKGGEFSFFYMEVLEDGTWDLESHGVIEGPHEVKPFWGSVLKLKAETDYDGFGDAWALEVPGLAGVYLYKCVFRPAPAPPLIALRHARWPGSMSLRLLVSYEEAVDSTLVPAESYVEDTGCLVHKYKGIVQDAKVVLHVSSPSPVDVDRIYFPVKLDGGLNEFAAQRGEGGPVPGRGKELLLSCTRRRGEHGDAWVLQAPGCPGTFLFKCFFLP